MHHLCGKAAEVNLSGVPPAEASQGSSARCLSASMRSSMSLSSPPILQQPRQASAVVVKLSKHCRTGCQAIGVLLAADLSLQCASCFKKQDARGHSPAPSRPKQG